MKPRAGAVARARAFLAAFRETCNVTRSAHAAGIKPRQHYRWLKLYPKYAAAFERAKPIAAAYLESVVIQRVTKGWLEPIMYQGTVAGHVRRFDHGNAMALLRAHMPEKYKASTEVSGPNGGPIETRMEIVFVRPKPEKAER